MSDQSNRIKQEPEHSPLPWSLEVSTEDGEGMMITIPEIERCLHDWEWAESADWDRDLANAELIVGAVNNHEALIQALKPFAAMHRIGSDPNETACVRGTASDLTAITSGDFELAFNALRDAGVLDEEETREPQLISA